MKKLIMLSMISALTFNVYAQDQHSDGLDPFASDIAERIEELDEEFAEEPDLLESMSGGSISSDFFNNIKGSSSSGCAQFSCKVFLDIQKSIQTATLYVDGKVEGEFLVSSGKNVVNKQGKIIEKHETPNFSKHPENRIYDKYSSSKFPGGDYNGLGNMPYAVFIKGGFAVHGTPKGNWSKLGKKASHGCVRMHPDNAKKFNRLVRAHSVGNTWITIRN